ncbi:MAG: FHA domain-containing protein [Halochromatium sp.]|uniref:FHA domain-containing protein n=1 Tax=Halochromatium sp. TaxID=2049430 RepID=UPI00397A15A7
MTAEQAMTATLEVTGGLHAGGRLALSESGMMVLGRATTCDLILGDEGVAERHCLIATHGASVQIRALDGAVEFSDGGRLEPPASAPLAPGRTFRLGAAEITLLDPAADAAGKDHAAATTNGEKLDNDDAVTRPGRGRVVPLPPMNLGSLAMVGVALTLTGLAYGMMGGQSQEVPGEESAQEVEEMPSDTMDLSTTDEAMATPDGESLAENVQEVLRLSGVRARTEYAGDGEVRVIGHFGDGERARHAIESRAMRAINGLERIVQVNLDEEPDDEEAEPESKPEVVQRMVGGDDPYLVLDDGSRLYPGAALGSGVEFRGVKEGRAVIDYGDALHRVDVVGQSLDDLARERGERIDAAASQEGAARIRTVEEVQQLLDSEQGES